MHLRKISLLNFKNYHEIDLDFEKGVNCFVGNNGAGKTNLLDAIHYLALCKSYFNPVDSQQIRYEQDLFVIQGSFEKNDKTDVVYCGLKRNQKKQFKLNKKEYPRLADHIGAYPLVMISPYDISLILDGSEERRKFIDNVLSQTDNHYLDLLITYNKVLANRNGLLKNFSDTGTFDADLIGIYNQQLAEVGSPIFLKRKEFLARFTSLFNEHYGFISGNVESVQLNYVSPVLSQTFETGFAQTLKRDLALERTNFGIHKDDLEFTISGHPLKKFGSQGQQKSFLIALKLAQYSYLYEQKSIKPLLLLDDIFDKLDDLRIRKLMEMVVKDHFGQIFITDTNKERVAGIFKEINVAIHLIEVAKGKIA